MTPSQIATTSSKEKHPAINHESCRFNKNSEEPAKYNDRECRKFESPNEDPRTGFTERTNKNSDN